MASTPRRLHGHTNLLTLETEAWIVELRQEPDGGVNLRERNASRSPAEVLPNRPAVLELASDPASLAVAGFQRSGAQLRSLQVILADPFNGLALTSDFWLFVIARTHCVNEATLGWTVNWERPGDSGLVRIPVRDLGEVTSHGSW